MLQLKDIRKEYSVGDGSVPALRGVSVSFRKNEFVAILGPSGCGKTTLLNIIGGLDHYTSGDLKINGVSTKEYRDGDWDAYRNHSIGFVFQSYNLIPHQSVLANVELALTISGVSKSKRRAMAVEALKKVGLGDQLKKRPNQMSGGQMQRVAIARALVNDPDILLADEPTGALDSETSVQVMEILKEIAKEKLVIMVTHNPELAAQYATRTIRLLDGQVTDDTMPYDGEEEKPAARQKKGRKKHPSMSLATAFSLSLNNLMTKKARTILTAFAGSIGIIGIALILSLSNGINLFIERVQEDTLSSYPITIEAESIDMSAFLSTMAGGGTQSEDGEGPTEPRDENAVYTSPVLYDLWNNFISAEAEHNDLTTFREYLKSEDNAVSPHLSALRYRYDLDFDVYVKNASGTVVSADALDLMGDVYKEAMGVDISQYSQFMGNSAGMSVWEEFLTEKDGTGINGVLKQQYDVVNGRWPEAYDEVVLVVNKRNEVSDLVLCTLGLKTTDELIDATKKVMNGEEISVDGEKWSFDEIVGRKLKMVVPAESYRKDPVTGGYTDLSATQAGKDYLFGNEKIGVELKIVGIIRPNEDAVANMLRGSLCYTGELTQKVLENIAQQDVITEQLKDRSVDVLSGLPFKTEENEMTDAEKAAEYDAYVAALSETEKRAVQIGALCIPSDEVVSAQVERQLSAIPKDQMRETMISFYEQQMGITSEEIRTYINEMDEETLMGYAREMMAESIRGQYAAQMQAQLSQLPAAAVDAMYASTEFTEAQKADFHDKFLPQKFSDKTYDEVLKEIGYVDKESPASISLYCDTFNEKDAVTDAIKAYNAAHEEEQQLSYTDVVALIMSSVSTILNAISYVLIAFVSISLVVSSIMIGIITYISVLERTKEIGILRAIGASKRDISRVFNAETLIIGLTAGIFGIGLTLLLTIPINYWVHALSGLNTINAVLPWQGAIILILISMFLTFIAGLIPARIAAKKDPVEALRTE